MKLVRALLLVGIFCAFLWWLLGAGSGEPPSYTAARSPAAAVGEESDSEALDTSREGRAAGRERLDRVLREKAARF